MLSLSISVSSDFTGETTAVLDAVQGSDVESSKAESSGTTRREVASPTGESSASGGGESNHESEDTGSRNSHASSTETPKTPTINRESTASIVTEPSEASTDTHHGLYSNVYALLMRWEEDDLESTGSELALLEDTLRTRYRFTTKTLYIPLENPYPAVQGAIKNIKNGEELSPEDLLIVYYIGHGALQDNMSFRMSCVPDTYDPSQPLPGFDWSSIQVGLEYMPCDVLILLDTCFAASTVSASQATGSSHRTEIIAAGGYADLVPGSTIMGSLRSREDQFFFTRALVEELYGRARSATPFTAAALHRGMLRRFVLRYGLLGKEQSLLRGSAGGVIGAGGGVLGMQCVATTPVHVTLGEDYRLTGIPLMSRKRWNGGEKMEVGLRPLGQKWLSFRLGAV
ncbi:hypothetical protein ONS95_008422 [Cadophora gregata]|uniref:uncharacterized protein n=1 Tax=Cadophora gregata TaxID=51156 RepID=UPI0026DB3E83|nr:uncharacterized protein ONS95_008422 [Cadophora gregata]KAK0126843.1 hypothetical protein ONS95_008422 [Cadophora gregata]